MESQYQNLVFLLRRLYRDTFSVVQKLKNQSQKGLTKKDSKKAIDNYNKFSDSINVLGLSPEELQMFVDPTKGS